MAEMTGGQALMKSLYLEGVRVIFGLPGVQLYHALDALYQEPGIRFITTRHEQATGYMADGYSRAGGEGIGTALMVPGPGLLNASGGISTAYAASSPIMVVCGQIERDLIGVNRGMLHEVDDQLDTIRPVTKWAQRVLNPADIPEAVHEAFRQLKTGRPRPVEIEVPPETLAELADVELREPEEPRKIQADRERVEKAAQMLTEADNPLIWVGGGAISSGASQALVKVAEHLQAGVISTAEGKGAISDNHPLSLGALWLRNDNIAKAFNHDVILAVGTRMGTPNLLGGQKIIQIDIDEEELGRNYDDTFGILGDARGTLEQLYEALSAKGPARPDRSSEIAAQKAARSDAAITREPQASLLGAVRSAMPDDGILVAGMTQVGYYSRAYFPVYQPRTFLTSSYSGNLGYAYPTALGAKVAQPDKAVVALSGDGGFLFNSQEMATAVQHGINAVVVVFNDNAFGNVLRDQVNRFEGRIIGAELHNPDFV
ncbi:MAG: thiamine pyrophosphate-binding protein, partial [Chloroflexi bacterium]|nr:thiamine pyrophosphate-binding protein [Chloroflexota bacterium]